MQFTISITLPPNKKLFFASNDLNLKGKKSTKKRNFGLMERRMRFNCLQTYYSCLKYAQQHGKHFGILAFSRNFIAITYSQSLSKMHLSINLSLANNIKADF